jgi:ABC-type transport system substrate-binding protein
VKFERDVILKFERFDGYWDKGKPYLDGIEIHYIKDPVTQVISLRAGDAHMLREVKTKDAYELQKEGLKVIHVPLGIRCFALDAGNPESIFTDKRLREAVEYAINKKPLVDALGYGLWEPAYQYSPKLCNSYIPGFVGRTYNPEKAKQLLAEAGYPNGLKTRLICNAIEADRSSIEAIQRDFKAVGIDAKVEYVDGGKYFWYQIKGWKNGLMQIGQSAQINFTDELNSLFQTGAVRLPSIKRTPELDAVLIKAQSVPDFETQKALTQKAAKMIYDDAIMIPLWIWSRLTVAYSNVHDTGFDEGNGETWTSANAWLSK